MQLANELAAFCERRGLTFFAHDYDYMVFGSWSLIIGNSHRRIRFSWDGRESCLDVSASEFTNSNSVPSWEPLLPGIAGTALGQADVFAFVKEKLAEHYGI